jgi:hypothetical protein
MMASAVRMISRWASGGRNSRICTSQVDRHRERVRSTVTMSINSIQIGELGLKGQGHHIGLIPVERVAGNSGKMLNSMVSRKKERRKILRRKCGMSLMISLLSMATPRVESITIMLTVQLKMKPEERTIRQISRCLLLMLSRGFTRR